MDESSVPATDEARRQQFDESRAALLATTEELADTGGWELDVRTETLRWTDGARHIHGVGPEYEPTLESALSFYHPDDRPTIATAVEAAITDGASYEETVRLVTADDELRWVHTRGEPVVEDGEVVRVYGALRDVTEQRERERALRTNTAKLQALTAAFPDLAFLLNGAGRYLETYASEDSESLLTDSPTSLKGKTVEEALPPGPADRITTAIERALETDEIQTIEYRLDVRAGTRWFEGRIAPLDEPIDEGRAVVMVARDVTDRHETERRLRERKAHLRNAQAVANLGSWIRDIPENEIWWSDGAYAIFERPRERGALDHEEFMSYVHPADRDRLETAWLDALDGDAYDVEHRIVVDGETKWVREKAEIEFDEDGTPQQAIGVVQDVTERKAYEQQLEAQNEQLAVLNRIMRHDLRNKMNVALSYAEEIDERFDGEPAALGARLRSAIDSLVALSEEVHDLRGLFETDHDHEPVALAPLVTEAVEHVRETHPDATYTTAIPEELQAETAPTLQVALTNLIENAVVHNEETDPRVEVTVEADDQTVRIAVSDNGPGIPRAEFEHLTGSRERSQLDHTSGLGLWTVRWIVSTCQGDLEFDPSDDGTTVTISLPRSRPCDARPPR